MCPKKGSRRKNCCGKKEKSFREAEKAIREARRKTTEGAEMRTKITLVCQECKRRNYDTMKEKKNNPDRLEMRKHCPFCRKHTLHKETK